MLVLLSPEVWKLRPTLEGERRARLLGTPFEEIVQQIVDHARIASCAMVRADKRPGYERIEIAIDLPPHIVDMFHSGAGGYRAQYYEGVGLGERANRYAIDALQALLHLESRLASQSMRHFTAKIWIREGTWCDDKPKHDRNLEVTRWSEFAAKHSAAAMSLKFEPICACLTPEVETHLEIKGAWIHEESREVWNSKPDRSNDLHKWGFT